MSDFTVTKMEFNFTEPKLAASFVIYLFDEHENAVYKQKFG